MAKMYSKIKLALFVQLVVIIRAWGTTAHQLTPEEIIKARKYSASIDDQDESWIDPFDMFAPDVQTVKKDSYREVIPITTHFKHQESFSLPEIPNEADMSVCSLSNRTKSYLHDFVFLSRWLRKFLDFVNYNSELKDVGRILKFPVSSSFLEKLGTLLNEETPNMNDVEEIFEELLANVTFVQDLGNEPSGLFNTMTQFTLDSAYRSELTIFVSVMSGVLATVYGIYKMSLYPRATAVSFVALLSFGWQWVALYKHALAKKAAQLEMIDFQATCREKEMGVVDAVILSVKRYFVSTGTCEKYYESVLVDPFWEVTPGMAISASLSNIIFIPLEVLSQKLNVFVKNLFSDLSWIMVLIVVLFFFISLTMYARYRIRFPFFLGSFEPTTPASRLPDSSPALKSLKGLKKTKKLKQTHTGQTEKTQIINIKSRSVVQSSSANSVHETEDNMGKLVLVPVASSQQMCPNCDSKATQTILEESSELSGKHHSENESQVERFSEKDGISPEAQSCDSDHKNIILDEEAEKVSEFEEWKEE